MIEAPEFEKFKRLTKVIIQVPKPKKRKAKTPAKKKRLKKARRRSLRPHTT